MNILDKFALALAPLWGLRRLQARLLLKTATRHYEAAATSHRTSNWAKSKASADVAATKRGILAGHARDLERNNSWARKGCRAIANHTVGWGIVPKPKAGRAGDVKRARAEWSAWADSTACDVDGRLNFYGLQRLVAETVARDGEALIRRRRVKPTETRPVPLQLQVLEPDFLDTSKDGAIKGGGLIMQGVEVDALGQRVAYWLFTSHPGGGGGAPKSVRVPADEVIHVYRVDRPGQLRGVTWLAPVILRLKDFDEYEDATLVRQKIAACFSAFITDPDGSATAVGVEPSSDPMVDELGPGMLVNLPPGKSVEFGNPPTVSEFDGYAKSQLRAIAAGLGIPYEVLTGDYSQVTFSSARMGRLEFQANLHDWRWNMLIPQFCDPAWRWFMEALLIMGQVKEALGAEWTPPPMPMLEPVAEAKAVAARIRVGILTPSDAVREQGFDPETHFAEYAADMKRLDDLGIVLDSDARKTSQAGLTQARPSGSVLPDPVNGTEVQDGQQSEAGA